MFLSFLKESTFYGKYYMRWNKTPFFDMKKDLNKILTILRSLKPHLRKTYNVKEIEIFGSYIRREQKKKRPGFACYIFKNTGANRIHLAWKRTYWLTLRKVTKKQSFWLVQNLNTFKKCRFRTRFTRRNDFLRNVSYWYTLNYSRHCYERFT